MVTVALRPYFFVQDEKKFQQEAPAGPLPQPGSWTTAQSARLVSPPLNPCSNDTDLQLRAFNVIVWLLYMYLMAKSFIYWLLAICVCLVIASLKHPL